MCPTGWKPVGRLCPTGFQPVKAHQVRQMQRKIHWMHATWSTSIVSTECNPYRLEAGGTGQCVRSCISAMEQSLYDLFYDEHEETIITWRNLPHWKQDGKLYFITWRQADSLPQNQLAQLRADRAAWKRQHGDTLVSALPAPAQGEYYWLFHHRVQAWLDADHGSCVLRRPDARQIMIEALHRFDAQRYRLGSFALAGNHVHVLVAPVNGVDLSSVMHSWKSFTASAINKAIGRTGPLWRHESYDRLIRDHGHLERAEGYIAAHLRQGAYVEHIPFSGGVE